MPEEQGELRLLIEAARREAAATHHRRLLVLQGSRDVALAQLGAALAGEPVLLVTDREQPWPAPGRRVSPTAIGDLLGQTLPWAVLDLHDALLPNVIGALTGLVGGGGLCILVMPDPAQWPAQPDGFADRLQLPAWPVEAVGRRFLRRFLRSLDHAAGVFRLDCRVGEERGARNEERGTSVHWEHGEVAAQSTPCALRLRGEHPVPVTARPDVAISAVGPGRERAVGLAEEERGARNEERGPTEVADAGVGPGRADSLTEEKREARSGEADATLAAGCRTADQVAALRTLELLLSSASPRAVVLVADRGRGKSAALGLFAAAALAAGQSVLVTGPGPGAVAEVFVRARAGLLARGVALTGPEPAPQGELAPIRTASTGATLRFVSAPTISAIPRTEPPLLLVDEAAALPVPLLDRLLQAAPRIAFATTVHGYEGTGQGFDVRFRAHLEADGHATHRVTLTEPIRWAPGDPVEAWCEAALLLAARPAPLAAVAAGQVTTVEWLAPDQDALGANEPLLREVFGLLTLAHYRTVPDDLARLLDAPNLATRLLVHQGHVVAVALLAREGQLTPELCAGLYLGRHRIRGHMLPETLVSHLGEEAAGQLPVVRVVRIAVYPELRGRGLGRHLLERVGQEAEAQGYAALGTGFAATPELLRFWHRCGFAPIRLGVTRSEISGEHSVLMLRGLDPTGRALCERLGYRFARSAPAILSDALRELDPEVALAALAATPGGDPPQLADWEWEDLIAATFGHRLYDVAVRPVWELTRAFLTAAPPPLHLPHRDRQRLLLKVIQRRTWPEVAAQLDEPLHGCMRGLREALAPVVLAYLPPDLHQLVTRFRQARKVRPTR